MNHKTTDNAEFFTIFTIFYYPVQTGFFTLGLLHYSTEASAVKGTDPVSGKQTGNETQAKIGYLQKACQEPSGEQWGRLVIRKPPRLAQESHKLSNPRLSQLLTRV